MKTVVLECPLVRTLASIVAHACELTNLPMQSPSTLVISAAISNVLHRRRSIPSHRVSSSLNVGSKFGLKSKLNTMSDKWVKSHCTTAQHDSCANSFQYLGGHDVCGLRKPCFAARRTGHAWIEEDYIAVPAPKLGQLMQVHTPSFTHKATQIRSCF